MLESRNQTVLPGPSSPPDREAWGSVFRSLAASAPFRGVVHLVGVRDAAPAVTAAELARELEDVGSAALALVQGLTDTGVRPESGIWFVTRGGQVLEEARSGTLSGALLWGFGAAVDLEHAELGARLVDLDPDARPSAAALAEEVLFPDDESRVALRSRGRRVPRLSRLRLESLSSESGKPDEGPGSPGSPGLEVRKVRDDRSYLVTGGLGRIGLEVARWLGESGAGAVVLNGRREPAAEAEARLAGLRERGVEVRVEVADVTDEDAVTGMLSRVEAELPPLGGVIHSVGALADGALRNLDWERFAEVLAPKVLGAWHLHRATLDRDLELFVLFSSAAGVVGNAGQANYAAANAFLDQLALYRRTLGLPGQAIAWGAWSELGEAARERIAQRLGGGLISPEHGIEALARLVEEDVGRSVVVAVDSSRFSLEDARLPEVVAGWQPGTDRPAASETRQLAERLRGLSGAEMETELVEFLADELAALLRLRAGPPPDAGFFDMGMDSLFAVEFGNRVTRVLPGVRAAPGTLVFDHPTIQRLARYLASELGGARDPEAPAAPAAEPATELAAEREAERIRGLSQEDFLAEVEARLDAGAEDS